MEMNKNDLTILHIEDHQLLAGLVRTAFESFGFRGDMINVGSVNAAVDLLGSGCRRADAALPCLS